MFVFDTEFKSAAMPLKRIHLASPIHASPCVAMAERRKKSVWQLIGMSPRRDEETEEEEIEYEETEEEGSSSSET